MSPGAAAAAPLVASVKVIGVGQSFRCDDAVGLWAIDALRGCDWLPPAIELLKTSGDGMVLMDLWHGASTAFLLDAVRSGQPPGTIHRFEAHETPLPADFFGSSSHLWGVAEAVEMARLFGLLPERLIVLGIEGVDFGFGEQLSPAVEAAIPALLSQLQDEFLVLG